MLYLFCLNCQNVASMGSEIKTLQSRVESLETSHKEMAENVQEVRNKVYELVVSILCPSA